MTTKINDLRSALNYLRTIPGQLVETNVEADPRAEISGIYRYVGAKGTVKRPTRLGPAMIFNNVTEQHSKFITGISQRFSIHERNQFTM